MVIKHALEKVSFRKKAVQERSRREKTAAPKFYKACLCSADELWVFPTFTNFKIYFMSHKSL